MAKAKDGWWGITTADEWQKATDALAMWCLARDQTRFTRGLVESKRGAEYSRRLLYLLGVAACRRVEDLLTDRRSRKALQTAEAFAEGTATIDELDAAHEAADAVDGARMPAAPWAAARAVYWLGPDDYRLTDGVEMVIDAAGYRAAVAAGVLAPKGGYGAGQDVWEHKAFIAGKKKEEKALCGVIREVLGNPFRPVKFLPEWRTDTAIALAKQMYESREFSAMPILADALQDAGCDNDEVLKHCRDKKQPHVRGCWVVDGVLERK